MSEFTDSIDHCLKGINGISPGAAACCPECVSAYGIDDTGDTDAMQEQLYTMCEPSFSWSQCDSCGSRLGGDREEAHGFDSDGQLYHLSICVDCVIFHANGEEPAQWQ